MSNSPLQAQPIRRLENRLANQIAAGEVVERPASVVKELLENAIDSGATRIEVEIERGGTRLIRVTDNGCGIAKEYLTLALSRHATSKITDIKDLAAIISLGFRGEALASIGSVSRLCLISRTHESQHAWQATAEGREMAVEIEPAAATVGTRVEVCDLFYNTPARQKFLRAEKTEFAHIEEVLKRHALANPSIAFVLKQRGKVVKRIPASQSTGQQLQRVGRICGRSFIENCVAFDCEIESVHLHGWLGLPHFHRSESDLQFVFVNRRPVKDKMLNHAIKQAYQGLLPMGRMATFVIMLDVDPTAIDVNVHPTKHEVRFEQSRMIHDLIIKSVSEALGNKAPLVDSVESASSQQQENRSSSNVSGATGYSTQRHSQNGLVTNYPTSHFSGSTNSANQVAYQSMEYDVTATTGICRHLIQRFSNGILMLRSDSHIFLVDSQILLSNYFEKLLNHDLQTTRKPLLFPQTLSIAASQLEDASCFQAFNELGFEVEPESESDCDQAPRLVLKKIPQWLANYPSEKIRPQVEQYLAQIRERSALSVNSLLACFFSDSAHINLTLIEYCLAQLKFPECELENARELTAQMAQGLLHDD